MTQWVMWSWSISCWLPLPPSTCFQVPILGWVEQGAEANCTTLPWWGHEIIIGKQTGRKACQTLPLYTIPKYPPGNSSSAERIWVILSCVMILFICSHYTLGNKHAFITYKLANKMSNVFFLTSTAGFVFFCVVCLDVCKREVNVVGLFQYLHVA